jgi:hypothetical protein
LILTYPASTGRNFDEILRVIDSLQLTANYSVATANWKDGQDVVISPKIKTYSAKFPKGFQRIKYYLRMTPQPNIVINKSKGGILKAVGLFLWDCF